MDKPHPLSCNTRKPSLPSRTTMRRPLALHRLLSGSLLLLVSLSSSGESTPRVAHDSTLDGDGTARQDVLLLEAVKMGILSSLGMSREPRPTHKATEKELTEMYQLYEEKLSEMRGDPGQISDTRQSTNSTVLFPTSVGTVRHRRTQWYRAVFHKNPHLQAELTAARAQLKVSRQILKKPTSPQAEIRYEVKVKVDGAEPMNSATWTLTDSPVNVSVTQDVTLDLGPEVEEWMRRDGGQVLVVDVGVVVAGRETLSANPTISMELGLMQPRPAQRRRRSNKEDDCDEQGRCCRKSVDVSFKDIGWTDWVLAPAEYTMHFCDGICPHNYKPASMHTQVKSRLHQITKGGTPRPCCVPAAYEPMVLLHYDSRGKLKLTPFDDFIVTKCHCA